MFAVHMGYSKGLRGQLALLRHLSQTVGEEAPPHVGYRNRIQHLHTQIVGESFGDGHWIYEEMLQRRRGTRGWRTAGILSLTCGEDEIIGPQQ